MWRCGVGERDRRNVGARLVDGVGEKAHSAETGRSRHHDGFVRQDSVARLLRIADDWTIPFVVHVIGEYVVEIVAVIAEELGDGDARLAGYRAFARENRAFVSLIRERAVSYWNCNYRAGWPTFDDYPARALLDRLGYRRRS